MNRRKFLKVTEATAVATITTPIWGKIPNTPQWIPINEKLPRIGQKIVLGNSRLLSGGRVISIEIELIKKSSVKISMKRDFTTLYDYDGRQTYFVFSEEGNEILRTKQWMKYNKGSSKIYDCRKVRGRLNVPTGMWLLACRDAFVRSGYCSKYYWLPVDGDYPQTLPPLPKTASVIRKGEIVEFTHNIPNNPPNTFTMY